MENTRFKYLAFISYSRADNDRDGRRWADWIKEIIEKFPIPINCLAAEQASGTTREVFLDRSRLTAGGELMPKLEAHLSQAEYLVVICSPKAASSKYVGFEIEYFRKSGRLDKIIPVVVDGGEARAEGGNAWIPPGLRDVIQANTPGAITATRDSSLIYSDFRTREKLPNQTVFEEEGWTDPKFYEKHLRSKNLYSDSVLNQHVAAYRQAHSVAKFALLGAVFGLEPGQLQGESLLEENERKRQVIAQSRRRMILLGAVASGMACMAAITYGFYRNAEDERLKSDRSLQMIGDAHERANRVMAELLNELQSTPEPVDKAATVSSARRVIGRHFDEMDPGGGDDESLQMRAVVLNSKGRLALKTGDLAVAHESFTKAAEIRKGLMDRNGPKPIHLHEVSISHDNLGDWHIAKARIPGADSAAEYAIAIDEYRAGLENAKELAARPDAPPQWNHDVAVSYLKVSAGFQEAGDLKSALQILKEGLPFAEKAAAGDRSYIKWQAHLGAYYLAIGSLHDALDQTAEARKWLSMGKETFSSMAPQDLKNPQYADWLKQIEEILAALPKAD
jgi:tetratricopeptide (TPR) repeat protein